MNKYILIGQIQMFVYYSPNTRNYTLKFNVKKGALLYSRLQVGWVGHCIMDDIKFEFNDIIY